MKKLLAILVSAVLIIFPLSACSGDDSGLKKVRLNEVTHSIFYAPLYLAMGLDYFKEEGIEIELTNGGGADKSMTAILSGSADIGLMGPESAIYVYQEGKQDYAQVFGQLTKRDGSFLVSRVAEPDFQWTDLENKTIIAGRRGGVPAMTFEYVCKNNGLINGRNIELNLDVAFNMMGGAFEGGTGDYVTLFEPTATEFQNAGKGHIVASVGQASGEIPYTAFIAKKSYIEKNEDTIKSFLKAVYRAIDYMQKNTDADVASKIVKYFEGTSAESVAIAVNKYKEIDAWMTNMAMQESAFIRLQTVMMSAGELEEYAPFSALANNTYAEEVYREVFAA